MTWSLKKRMLVGLTATFFFIEVLLIILASLLIDDFLIYSDVKEFENLLALLQETSDEDGLEIETVMEDARQLLGGFTSIVLDENSQFPRELQQKDISEAFTYLEESQGEIYQQVSDDNIFLAAKIDETYVLINSKSLEIIEDMRKVLNIYLGTTSVVVFLIIFLATYFYLDLFVKPIVKIKDATKRIAEFNFDETIEVHTKDELSDLAEGINLMSKQLRENMSMLIEKERLASLGEIVAGVAHEINTPLGVAVSSSTYLNKINKDLIKQIEEENLSKETFIEFLESVDESTSIIATNLDRAANLVRSFKQISVNQTSDILCEFYLKEYMDAIILALKHEYKGKRISFHIHCSDQLRLNSYPGILSQIMTILLMNSIVHGFKDRKYGDITIEVIEQENAIIFIYSDNGKGIREEDLQHIFEPFFTTDRENGGSGLGLNICYNLVVQKLGGKIQCESVLNKSTHFTINIPRKRRTISYEC